MRVTIRRVASVAASLAGITLALPVLALAALAIKCEDRGPVLFAQERIGRGGRPFRIYKLRTMRQGHTGQLVTPCQDARVTKIGRVLRKTKIDELPQLMNVLRGDMGFVGPRPEVALYAAMWSEEQRDIILSIPPGITDPASIAFRNEGDLLSAADDPAQHYIDNILPKKARMYVDYVERRSFWSDIGITLRTLLAVARG